MNLTPLAHTLPAKDFIALYKEASPLLRASLIKGSPDLEPSTLLKIIDLAPKVWKKYAENLNKKDFEKLASLSKNKEATSLDSLALLSALIAVNPKLAILGALDSINDFHDVSELKTNKFLTSFYIPFKKLIDASLDSVPSNDKKLLNKALEQTEKNLIDILFSSFTQGYHPKEERPYALSQLKLLPTEINKALESNAALASSMQEFVEKSAFSLLWLEEKEAKLLHKEIKAVSPLLITEIEKIHKALALPLNGISEADKDLKLDWIDSFSSTHNPLEPAHVLSIIEHLGLTPSDLALFYTKKEFMAQPFNHTKPARDMQKHHAYNLMHLFASHTKAVECEAMSNYLISAYENLVVPKHFHTNDGKTTDVEVDFASKLLAITPIKNKEKIKNLFNQEEFKSYFVSHLPKASFGKSKNFQSLVETFGDYASVKSYLGDDAFKEQIKYFSFSFAKELVIDFYTVNRNETGLKLELYTPDYLKDIFSLPATEHEYQVKGNSLLPMPLILLHHLTLEEETAFIGSKTQYHKESDVATYRNLYESTVKPLSLSPSWLEEQVLSFAQFYIKDYNAKADDIFLKLDLNSISNDSIMKTLMDSQAKELKAVFTNPKNAVVFNKISQVMLEKQKPVRYSEVPNINRPKY